MTPGIKRAFYLPGKAIHRKPAAIPDIEGDIVNYAGQREGSKPRFDTILKMLDALGMQFAIVPKLTSDAG